MRQYLRFWWLYFKQFWKSRMVYKTDFVLGSVANLTLVAVSLLFITLLYTQTQSIAGWSYYEVLFLSGVGGVILNLQQTFMYGVYHLGEKYIVRGRLDRLLIRPLNPLFQLYVEQMSDDTLARMVVNAGLIAWTVPRIGLQITPLNLLYGIIATVSGALVFAAIFLVFASTAFWTGRSKAAIRILFSLYQFRKYPFGVYGVAVQVLLVTVVPIAFAAIFPAAFLLGKPGGGLLQVFALGAGPVFFWLAYRFWKHGLSRYNSTGS
jgi:ABC-2 type transport system permease protein